MGRNGRHLTAAEMARLDNMVISVVAHKLGSSGQTYSTVLSRPYKYQMMLPAGTYQIRVESQGRLSIASRPVKYRISISKPQDGLHFTLRFKRTRLVDDPASEQQSDRNRKEARD